MKKEKNDFKNRKNKKCIKIRKTKDDQKCTSMETNKMVLQQNC